jgi:hypothetical protein
MGNVSFKVINHSTCILNVYLIAAGAPWYWEYKVLPNQTVERSVGQVWFSTGVDLWSGDGPEGYQKYRDIQGHNYTVFKQLAIPGLHLDLLRFPYEPLTNLTKRLANKYESLSESWLMNTDRVVEVTGGPYCDLRNISYVEEDGKIYNKEVNYFDNRTGLPDFHFRLLSPPL